MYYVLINQLLNKHGRLLYKHLLNFTSWHTLNIFFIKVGVPWRHPFNVPHSLWHGTSIHNCHLRWPLTFAPIAERLAVELWLPVLIRTPNTSAWGANALTDCDTSAVFWSHRKAQVIANFVKWIQNVRLLSHKATSVTIIIRKIHVLCLKVKCNFTTNIIDLKNKIPSECTWNGVSI